MPCPFFEPRTISRSAKSQGARLPLLDEYEGVCHAGEELVPAPAERRLACCNHGYSRGACPRFPLSESRSAIRFDVVRTTPEVIEILLVEEQDHFPLGWRSVRYAVGTGQIEPQGTDICADAQISAFCRSYLRKFQEEFNQTP
jgi:hypothetical protein